MALEISALFVVIFLPRNAENSKLEKKKKLYYRDTGDCADPIEESIKKKKRQR